MVRIPAMARAPPHGRRLPYSLAAWTADSREMATTRVLEPIPHTSISVQTTPMRSNDRHSHATSKRGVKSCNFVHRRLTSKEFEHGKSIGIGHDCCTQRHPEPTLQARPSQLALALRSDLAYAAVAHSIPDLRLTYYTTTHSKYTSNTL